MRPRDLPRRADHLRPRVWHGEPGVGGRHFAQDDLRHRQHLEQFTAFAIGLLAQDGKLSLDDPIRKHIPELGAYADGIKLGDLVHHTSGLRDYLGLMALAGYGFDDVTDDQDALRLIVKQKAANFPPNSEWLYSNTGYFLLSQVVKRVSGQTLPRLRPGPDLQSPGHDGDAFPR